MILTIIQAAIKLFLPVLDYYLRKSAANEEARKDYLAFVEIMNRKGLASVSMRMKAKDQIGRVADMWKKESEEAEKNGY